MTTTLTIDKLLDYVTPRGTPETGRRIPKDVYDIRKDVLMKKLTHITNVLKTNHWAKLTELTNSLPGNTTPVGFLTRVCKMKFCGVDCDRSSSLIYSYVLDLYTIAVYLHLIEARVEDSIEYHEVNYDD